MSGTAQDFAKWSADAKRRTLSELRYIVKDCYTAMQAMHGWNPDRENYYADQGHTYADELARRLKPKG